MSNVTWERGLMRVWLVITIIIALPIVSWMLAVIWMPWAPDSLVAIGLLLLVLAAQQLVSYGVARLIVWLVRGFGAPRPAPPSQP